MEPAAELDARVAQVAASMRLWFGGRARTVAANQLEDASGTVADSWRLILAELANSE